MTAEVRRSPSHRVPRVRRPSMRCPEEKIPLTRYSLQAYLLRAFSFPLKSVFHAHLDVTRGALLSTQSGTQEMTDNNNLPEHSEEKSTRSTATCCGSQSRMNRGTEARFSSSSFLECFKMFFWTRVVKNG